MFINSIQNDAIYIAREQLALIAYMQSHRHLSRLVQFWRLKYIERIYFYDSIQWCCTYTYPIYHRNNINNIMKACLVINSLRWNTSFKEQYFAWNYFFHRFLVLGRWCANRRLCIERFLVGFETLYQPKF